MSGGRRPGAGLVAVLIAVAAALTACSQRQIPVAVPPTSASATAPVVLPATPGRSTNSRDVLVESGGDQRRYRLHLPLAAPPGPRPLLVLLHAGGSTPQAMEFSIGMDSVADRLGLLVAYPEALSGYWNNGRAASVRRSGGRDDTRFVRDVVTDVERRAAVDPARVFVGGHADGAVMAAQAAASYPAVFTGLAMVSGQLLAPPGITPSGATALLMIHGTRDPVFPAEGLQDTRSGSLLSVDDSLALYRRALRVGGPELTVPRPDRDPRDGTRVTRTTWGPHPAQARVTLFTVVGGGSPWPGGLVQTRTSVTRGRTSRDLDASSVIGHFVLDTRRPPAR